MGARLDVDFGREGHIFPAGLTGVHVAEGKSGRLVTVAGGRDAFLVSAFRPNGLPDRRFGDAGTAEIPLTSLVRHPPPGEGVEDSGGAIATAVDIQPDGAVLVAGTYHLGAGIDNGAVAILARLTAAGAIDRSFGGSRVQGGVPGQVILAGHSHIYALALHAGSILVGGGSGRGFVGRFHSDGSLDRSFGGSRRGGWVSLPPRPHERVSRINARVVGLLWDRDGTILAAGDANGKLMLAHLDGNGGLDRRFAGHGIVKTNGSARPHCHCSVGVDLARDRHRRLLVVGSLESTNGDSLHRQIVLVRYTPRGSLDRRFGRGGLVRTSVNTASYADGLTIQRDGRIIVAGSSARAHRGSNDGPASLALLRYLPGGRLDPSFFGDGIFESRFGGIEAVGLDPLIDRRGRLVVAGGVTHGVRFQHLATRGLLARFLPGT